MAGMDRHGQALWMTSGAENVARDVFFLLPLLSLVQKKEEKKGTVAAA